MAEPLMEFKISIVFLERNMPFSIVIKDIIS